MEEIQGTRNLKKGIASLIFSSFSFALMAMFVHLAGDIPFVQKAFFRNIVAFFVALSVILKNQTKIVVPKGSFKYLITRCIAGAVGVFGNFYALDRIPIADATILNKMAPFFTVLFSLIILGEKVKLLPFMCVAGAFVGAVFVIKPSVNIIQSLPAIVAFLGGVGAGVAYTCVRKLSSLKMTGAFIVLFFSAFTCLLSVPSMILDFTPMTLKQTLILIGAGLAAAGGQFGVTTAYYNAPARDISVYDYSQILFSAILGYIAFRQIPDFYSLIGYVIIISMAIIVFVYNKKKGTGVDIIEETIDS